MYTIHIQHLIYNRKCKLIGFKSNEECVEYINTYFNENCECIITLDELEDIS